MLKKISLLIVLALVIGMFSACVPAGQLTEWKKSEIEDAWYGTGGAEKEWCWDPNEKDCCLYYGNVDGYDILLRPIYVNRPIAEKHTIGEATFEFPYPFRICTYKDGKMNTLSNLYKHEKISDEMVAEVAKRHENKETYQLSENKKRELPQAESRMMMPLDWNAEDGEPGAVRYYGSYEGYDVLFIFPWSVADLPGYVVAIGGIEFRVPVGDYAFVAYKDHKLYRVYELYGKGQFSLEVMEKIIAKHNTYDNG